MDDIRSARLNDQLVEISRALKSANQISREQNELLKQLIALLEPPSIGFLP